MFIELNKMKVVIVQKSSQKINVKLLHVTCSGDSLKLKLLVSKGYENLKLFWTVFLHFV